MCVRRVSLWRRPKSLAALDRPYRGSGLPVGWWDWATDTRRAQCAPQCRGRSPFGHQRVTPRRVPRPLGECPVTPLTNAGYSPCRDGTRARPPDRPRTRPCHARLLGRARDPAALLPRLLPAAAHGPRAHSQGRPRAARREPPQLLGPVPDRLLPRAPAALRRQDRAVRQALEGLDPAGARRLPDPPRRVRRGGDGDGPHHPRAGRRGRHLPRGHARAPRARSASPSAASGGWRSRPARRSSRSRSSAPRTSAGAGASARAA